MFFLQRLIGAPTDARFEHVCANGLKTARLVKLIFHTVLWGARTHTNTRVGIWKMGTRGVGLGGRGGWVGASDVHVV